VRVLLVPNPVNPRSVDAVRDVSVQLTMAGYEPVLTDDDARACDLPELGISRADVGAPGLVVAFGGDGTILKAAHLVAASESPILGVNLGRLGFLSGADGENVASAVESALAGEGRVECRQTIEARVTAGGREAGGYRALNEVLIGRGGSRGIELAVAVNGQEVGRYICDGLVVATPTGSTAYALSAGGPLLSPEVRGAVVVPVAPHSVRTRPIVTGPADVIEVSCPNPARADACVSVDGDQVPCRTSLESVIITPGRHDVRLVKLDGRDFYAMLARTFLGA